MRGRLSHIPELLAPAGTREVLEAVIEAGADSVYLAGRSFGMRQHGHWLNFGPEEIVSAVEFAHRNGVRAYVAVNSLLSDAEIDLLHRHLRFLHAEVGPDALIIQDLGMIEVIDRLGLDFEIHASTMMNCHSPEAALALRELGFTRIVPSRDISLDQIQRIGEVSGLEIEVFIQGDMCIAHSGQCFASGISAGESANRGKCLKPCRWQWDFIDLSTGQEFSLPDGGRFLLAKKDLCMLWHLPRLAAAGAHALKIEGRQRNAQHLRPIVSAWREALDRWGADPMNFTPSASAMRSLIGNRIRDLSTSFAFGQPGRAGVDASGRREPRIFSRAIEERPLPLEAPAPMRDHRPATTARERGLPRPALLVRCGDPESARRALASGADWIAVGGEIFPAHGQAWSLAVMSELADEAHALGRHIALVTPRITLDRDLAEMGLSLSHLRRIDLDQVLISNLGAWRCMQRLDGVPLWADHSLNVFNAAACRQLDRMGFAGVTAALETTYPQLVALAQSSPLPVEALAHGPQAGMLLEHCLPAAVLLNSTSDAPCPAPCRERHFALRDELGQIHPLATDHHCRNHLLQPCDLCTLRHLDHLADAGVSRLRIEAHWSTPDLVEVTTALYRRALDTLWDSPGEPWLPSEADWRRLLTLSPRPFSLGALANAPVPVAQPDKEMPDHAVIRFGT